MADPQQQTASTPMETDEAMQGNSNEMQQNGKANCRFASGFFEFNCFFFSNMQIAMITRQWKLQLVRMQQI